jgi:hypothetical protein
MVKTHTVQQSQPNDPNPNTAESIVKNAHRTRPFASLPLKMMLRIFALLPFGCFDKIYDGNDKSKWTPEMNVIGHMLARLKRTCVGSNVHPRVQFFA